jgi:hypothetical protein
MLYKQLYSLRGSVFLQTVDALHAPLQIVFLQLLRHYDHKYSTCGQGTHNPDGVRGLVIYYQTCFRKSLHGN